MSAFFDDDRSCQPGDPELDIIGDKEKLCQWRHKGMGPPYYKLGRKVIYRGADLIVWIASQRVEPASSLGDT